MHAAAKILFEYGPQPGLLGDVTALHGRYYAQNWGFPISFECKVAREMGDFLSRYDPARDLVVSVKRSDRIVASITLDASDPALAAGMAHLRWFVVDGSLQGHGIGKRLLDEAVLFARRSGLTSIYLTTFQGLHAASALYTAAGFRVVEEFCGETWGGPVIEQRLEMSL